MRNALIALSLATLAAPLFAQAKPAASPAARGLIAAIDNPARSEANRARDRYRHPAQTLAFFGVKPSDTVVEIWPGGGWYTEILAPYLASGGGKLIVATPPGRASDNIAKFLAADPSRANVQRANFPSVLGGTPVAPGTADVVLTFRNVHNWRMGEYATDKQDYSEAAFRDMFAMLKPGGTLGVVDHRLPESADPARERTSGYLKMSTIRHLAEAAGFRFVASSEVNANPKDTADYPKGVWTLPPTYTEGDKDRARYAAIGESDRMTLKFVKPRP